MKFYIATNGEIIEPRAYDINVYDPADLPRDAVIGEGGVEIEPAHPGTLIHKAGDEIPIAERFTPEFVQTLREYDPVAEPNPPEREPPPQPPATADQVKAQRDSLLAVATLRIAPLQDAVDLDEATAAETALLKLWKQYRVALSRIEQQSGFPAAVDWPKAPA